MLKHKGIAFILLTAVLVSGKAYCQQGIKGQQIWTIAGKVIQVDPEGNVIDVQIDNGMMVFNITVQSDLLQGNHHMAAIEITQGDPVIIQYTSPSSDKNEIIHLVDNRSNNN